MEVVLEDGPGARGAMALTSEPDGYWSGTLRQAAAGTLYRFRLDGEGAFIPIPASRFQPEGPHGPSQVVDPRAFAWTDGAWPGVRLDGQVIYEMHVGTFTRRAPIAAASASCPNWPPAASP